MATKELTRLLHGMEIFDDCIQTDLNTINALN